MTAFSTADLVEMIDLLQHQLELIEYAQTAPAKPQFNLPAQYGEVVTPVRGYVVTKSRTIVAIANAEPLGKGGMKAYVLGVDVSVEQLNKPGLKLRANGVLYQFTRAQPVIDAGVIQLHVLELEEPDAEPKKKTP